MTANKEITASKSDLTPNLGAGHSTGAVPGQEGTASALLEPYLISYSLACIKLNHIKAYYCTS